MSNLSTPLLLSASPSTIMATTTTSLLLKNDTIFNIITRLLNGTDLYKHQAADLMEPEKFPIRGIHIIFWAISILTYIFAIPVAIRMVRSRAYLNIVDYFSLHLILCAFVAWIPTFIFFLNYWFQLFTLRLCRLHYVILTTNETVPFFFVLYMIIERFLYAHPSIKQKCTQFSRMYYIHLYAIFTWLLIMLIYAFASPFNQPDLNSPISIYTKNYCPYNYSKLHSIASARSIIYFCLCIPALILIGFVLRYFYLLRGTNQVPPIQKLWTIRVTSLLCMLVFYDAYLYYLEHVGETFKTFLLASVLRSTFYTVQLFIIVWTEPYWIEVLFERCGWFCCLVTGRRRNIATPVALQIETEINDLPSTGHYSLVDDTANEEFDGATSGPQPTLRVIV